MKEKIFKLNPIKHIYKTENVVILKKPELLLKKSIETFLTMVSEIKDNPKKIAIETNCSIRGYTLNVASTELLK